jgi:hypothetical protein
VLGDQPPQRRLGGASSTNQPDGTPTWIDLAIPDLERAMGFYGALFGWEFQVGVPETMHQTQCLLGGRRVGAQFGLWRAAATSAARS